MSQKLIIAVCSTTGPQSGKSSYLETVVKSHLEKTEQPYTHLRFSDPLIAFLCESLHYLHPEGCSGRDSYEELKRAELLPGSDGKPSITGRDIMKAMGDSLRNALRPSLYADIFLRRLESVSTETVILDDLRKIPELEALVNSEHHILVVHVRRPEHTILLEPGQTISDLNDCEFRLETLRGHTWHINDPNRFRLLEVTWDDKGGFKTEYRNFVREPKGDGAEVRRDG